MKTQLLNKKEPEKKEEEQPVFDRKDLGIYLKLIKPFFLPHGFQNRLRTFSTYIIIITSKLCNAFSPLFLTHILNKIGEKDWNMAAIQITIMIFLRMSGMILSEAQSYVYNEVKRVAFMEISDEAYRHITQLSYDWHLKKKMGSVLRSMDRGVQSCDTIVNYLIIRLGSIIIECSIQVFMLFTILKSPWVALVLCVGLLLQFIVTQKLIMWRKKFRTNMNKSDNKFHERYTDALNNYESVKFMASEDYEIEMYNVEIKQQQEQNKLVQNSLNVLNSVQQVIINVTVIGCLIICAQNIVYEGMSINSFVTVQVLMFQAFQPIQFLGMVFQAVTNGFVDIYNLAQMFKECDFINDIDNSQELKATTKDKSGYIEFKNVSFAYHDRNNDTVKRITGNDDMSTRPNSIKVEEDYKINEEDEVLEMGVEPSSVEPNQAIRSLSFRVNEGESCAFVGETGSGKSTIVRLLQRFQDLTEGSIEINGTNIAHCSQKSLRHNLGIVPQDTTLFNSTLIFNLTYGSQFINTQDELVENKEAQEKVMKACVDAKLMAFVERQPDKFNTKVGERGLRLSGGEKQRVSIARCLIRDPAIIVLDEATSSLDSVTEREIQSALEELTHRTSFVVAHRLSTIMNCDKIVVMGHGRILEMGTHNELLELKGKQYTLWKTQEKE